jgi:hypothetical protein
MFKEILPELKEKYDVVIACHRPDLFQGENTMTIAEGLKHIPNPDDYNIYKFMMDRNWKESCALAFKEMYL